MYIPNIKLTSILPISLGIFVLLTFSACKEEEPEPATIRTVSSLRFIDDLTIAANSAPDTTVVGGLSSIDYDGNSTWYMISDDQGSFAPPRFYTASLSYDASTFSSVTINATVNLKTESNEFFTGSVDPEAIRFDSANQHLYWASEGNRNTLTDPFIREVELNGGFVRDFDMPEIFSMDTTEEKGPRQNGVFESLSLSADGSELIGMMELPLYQDGPAPSLDAADAPARIVFFNKASGNAVKQLAYMLDPVAEAGSGFIVNGAVEVLAVNDSILLVMERSFTAGVGNFVKIYKVDTSGATDVSGIDALAGATYTPVSKTLLLTINDLTLADPVDNIEGMSWGPVLENGNLSLVLVSDDNFSLFDPQVNQFLVFEVLP